MTAPTPSFLNTGRDKKLLGLQRRPTWEIIADVRRNRFEMVVAGRSGFPHFNPRKNILRNCTNLVWRVVCHPNLMASRVFPFSKLSVPLAGIDMGDSTVIDNSRFHILEECACFFKRELPANWSNVFLYTTPKTEVSGNITQIDFFRNVIKKLRPISLGVDSATTARAQRFQGWRRKRMFSLRVGWTTG